MSKKPTGTLVFPSVGVMEYGNGYSDPAIIRFAYRPLDDPDKITVRFMDDNEESYDAPEGAAVSFENGRVTFPDDEDNSFTLRPLTELDGYRVSRFHIPIPVPAIRSILTNPERRVNMAYLQDETETMVAFSEPDGDLLIGLLYINRWGAYVRQNGAWIMVPPNDDTFDDTTPYVVNADTAEEFVDLFDSKLVTSEEALQYTTIPGSGIDTDVSDEEVEAYEENHLPTVQPSVPMPDDEEDEAETETEEAPEPEPKDEEEAAK